MKRLVETDRWRDLWFVELLPNSKLMLSYLYDNCDDGGFIDVHYATWSSQLKMTKELIITSLKELQPALLSDKKKKLFIKDFLKHQKKLPLTKGNEEHDWIISKLKNNLEKFDNSIEILNILNNHVIDPIEQKTTKATTSKKKVFVEPTFEELKAYYLKQKPDAELENIEDIYDHYVSVGWVVGKNKPMVDWESCVRKAIRNQQKFGKSRISYGNINENNKQSRTQATMGAVDKFKPTDAD